jgi:hypothetical protein
MELFKGYSLKGKTPACRVGRSGFESHYPDRGCSLNGKAIAFGAINCWFESNHPKVGVDQW